jgi:signal transduction histidine kinase/ActR/RegA family two-component response regulator
VTGAALRPYGIAAAAVAAALLVRLPLQPLLGVQYAYVLFYPAVFAAAWIAGLRGGLAAGLLAAVCARYLFIYPARELPLQRTEDRIAEAIFIGSCVMVSYISEQRRRAITRAAARDAERNDLLADAERARLAAEEANRLKDEFLMTLSHELRTPLNTIWGWARILRDGHLDEARCHRAVEVIERNAQMQFHLVEDLLEVSRIVTGKLRITVQRLDLLAVVTAALESIRPAADAKGLHLEMDVEPSIGTMTGDADRLQQVIWNLGSNAVKFTPPGGRVCVLVRRVDHDVEISVSDTGGGIDPAMLPVIFERFRQAESGPTRSFSGLGLGLAIARSLVEAHGGTIHAFSDGVGRGATFRVRLPSVAQTPGEHASVAGGDSRATRSARGKRLDDARVLVVEDDADARELIETLLRDAGAVVRCERTASDGLAALTEFNPSVLVIDIELPGEDGDSLIRRVRASQDGAPRRPAIALTAYAHPEDRTRALEAGFDGYLTKPIDRRSLTSLVGALLVDSGRGKQREGVSTDQRV